jgi:hypothetical protein
VREALLDQLAGAVARGVVDDDRLALRVGRLERGVERSQASGEQLRPAVVDDDRGDDRRIPARRCGAAPAAGRAQYAPVPRSTTGNVWARMRRSRASDMFST